MDNYEDLPLDVLLRDLFDLGALSERRRWTPDDQIDYDTTVEAIKKAAIREDVHPIENIPATTEDVPVSSNTENWISIENWTPNGNGLLKSEAH